MTSSHKVRPPRGVLPTIAWVAALALAVGAAVIAPTDAGADPVDPTLTGRGSEPSGRPHTSTKAGAGHFVPNGQGGGHWDSSTPPHVVDNWQSPARAR